MIFSYNVAKENHIHSFGSDSLFMINHTESLEGKVHVKILSL